MVKKFKAMMLAGVLVSGSFAATHASAGFVTAGLTSHSAQSGVVTADGSVSNLQSSGLLIKVAGNGKGKGKGGGNSNGGGNGSSSSGGNGSSTSSSSGGGSVPVPSPLFLILGMAGVAVMRRRKPAQ